MASDGVAFASVESINGGANLMGMRITRMPIAVKEKDKGKALRSDGVRTLVKAGSCRRSLVETEWREDGKIQDFKT
jgi:hypothetical protein